MIQALLAPDTQTHFFEEVLLQFEQVWFAALFLFLLLYASSISQAQHFCVAAGADGQCLPFPGCRESPKSCIISNTFSLCWRSAV